MRIVKILSAFAMLFSSGTLPAQAPTAIRPDSGAHVRFTRRTDFSWQRGRLLRLDDGVLRVRRDTTGEMQQVPLDSLTQFEVATPRTTGDGAERGALIGLLTGASLTFVSMLLVRASHADEDCHDCSISATAVTGILGVLGTGVLTLGGALIGAAAPGEEWAPFALGSRSAQRRGAQLQLAVRVPWTLGR